MCRPWDIAGGSCLGDAFLERDLCSHQIFRALRCQHPAAMGGIWDPLGYLGAEGPPDPWAKFLDGCSAPTLPPTAAAASVQLEMRQCELSSQGKGVMER